MNWKKNWVCGIAAAIVAGDIAVTDATWVGTAAAFLNPVNAAEAQRRHPAARAHYRAAAREHYRGVARRTARTVVAGRAVRRAVRTAYWLSVLPAGCRYVDYYYACGNVYYQRMDGRYVRVILE